MYDETDPRAALAPSTAPSVAGIHLAAAEYGRFDRDPPAHADANGRNWYLRGQNFVLHHIDAAEGGCFARITQPDEYALIVPDREMTVEVGTDTERVTVQGGSVVFVPPGDSMVRALCAGRLVRLVTALSTDLMEKCANRDSYRAARPNIPPFAPWPVAANGPKIRAYPLEVPPAPGRFGSIYRCSTFMINAIERFEGPRDKTRMSPHHHDDFEQCSLAVAGTFDHHIRWPWTINMEEWREDEHERCGSPSAVVIPPPAIHTTRAVGAGTNRLIDIFCPPRADFSSKPGWVLNADDYPMPGAG